MGLSLVMLSSGSLLASWGSHNRLLSALKEVTGIEPESGKPLHLGRQQLETLIERADRPQGIGECMTGLAFGIPYKYGPKDRRRDLKAMRLGMKILNAGGYVSIVPRW